MLKKKGQYFYGDSAEDLRAEISRYSTNNAYPATEFADSSCSCGGISFKILLDDAEGVAIRVCVACGVSHPMADSSEYLEGADPEECECPCDGSIFQISAGLALYEGSEDVKWLYVGCRCLKCGLVAVYGDWKSELEDFRAVLKTL